MNCLHQAPTCTQHWPSTSMVTARYVSRSNSAARHCHRSVPLCSWRPQHRLTALLKPPVASAGQPAPNRLRCCLSLTMGRLPENVYEEYCMRRKGIVRALTADVDAFFQQCDPERENLCLYGLPDGTWRVDLPAEEVPPEIPEPALGINFARDGMQRRDWLALVSVHSDSWLLALAFYKGARLNKDQRDELFTLINTLPTCYEVVSGKAKPNSTNPAMPRKRGFDSVGSGRQQRPRAADDDFDDEEHEAGWHDGEGDPCPGCRRLYRKEEFWIACDKCDIWWCGRCSKMTEAKAEKTKSWQCQKCSGRYE